MMDHQEGDNPFAEVELEGGTMGDGNAGDFAEGDSLLENNNNSDSNSNQTAPQKPAGMCSCFSIAFYQPYFNVDTVDVKERLIRSIQGFKQHDFVEYISQKPDLYGPFWIYTTLIFIIGATANFASYLSFVATKKNPVWNYDFTLLTGAAALIYGFGIGVSAGLWIVCRYFRIPFNLLQSACVYGYAHSVYIAAAIICIIPSNAIGWIGIMFAFGVAAASLGFNLLAYLKKHVENIQQTNGIVGAVLLSHAIFAVLLKLYFFKHIQIVEEDTF
jgi:protein YIPF1/2